MYLKNFLILICVAFLLPQLVLAQGADVFIDGSAIQLTTDCNDYNGSNALPDGIIIQIRWDQDSDGPETTDPLLTVGAGVGEWNYNQFALNGVADLNTPGAFFPATALMSNGILTQNPIFFAVMQPNNLDFQWCSGVFTLVPEFNYVFADSITGGWQCQNPPPLGRCCYCDSLGLHCVETTQFECLNSLGGQWDANLTCATPCATVQPQAWISQNSGMTNWIQGVDFVGANNGWAVGESGTILHTVDGGCTWVTQSSGTTNRLAKVVFADASHGWAVGEFETILHTQNAGLSWALQHSGTTFLRSVTFVDVSEGWAVGDGGMILHTTDGGTSWLPQTSTTAYGLIDVAFTDAMNGWAVGDLGIIARTTNGGNIWQVQSVTTATLIGVDFIDPLHGWATGSLGTIMHSVDGGISWQPQPSGSSEILYRVAFVDLLTGWTIGRNGTILHTSDGGTNWAIEPSGTTNWLTDVSFVDAENGWAVGEFGTILRYGGCPCVPDSGRCCYCDSLSSQCEMTTQTQCATLGGQWDATKTCADPCSTIAQLRLDPMACHDSLSCINGVLQSNPLSMFSSYANFGTTTCNNISFTVGGGTGQGGTAIITNMSPVTPSLPGQTGWGVNFDVLVTSTTATGGEICFVITVSSDCCGPDSLTCCVYVPPCTPCLITCQPGDILEYPERQDSTNAYWDSNGGCNDSIPTYQLLQCGDTVCGRSFTYIGPGSTPYRDTDWYRIPVPCQSTVSLTVEAEFAFAASILDVADCNSIQVLATITQDTLCATATITAANLAAGGLYAVVVQPLAVSGFPMSHYRAWLACSPLCPAPATPDSLVIQWMSTPQSALNLLTCTPGSGGSVPVGYNIYEQEDGGTGNHPSRYIGTLPWTPQMENPEWEMVSGPTVNSPFVHNRYQVRATTHLPRPDLVLNFNPSVPFDTIRVLWNHSDSLIIQPSFLPNVPNFNDPHINWFKWCSNMQNHIWFPNLWEIFCTFLNPNRVMNPDPPLIGIYGIAAGDSLRYGGFAYNAADSLVFEVSRIIIVNP